MFLTAIPLQEANKRFFVRGDVNGDGVMEMSDAVRILRGLFFGESLPCPDAADTNDDGFADPADALSLLGYLFLGRGDLPFPFVICGLDPTKDELGCAGQARCGG